MLAFVALSRGRVERAYAAGVLWPFSGDSRAAGNLRSALWRMRQAGIDVICADKWSLTLAENVLVDVQVVADWANRLAQGPVGPEDLSLDQLPVDVLCLLPGWCDDWAIMERERLRQRVLHGMEALSRRLAMACRHQEAVDVARIAIAAEPLRESAQRVLLEAHLSNGQKDEARRAFAEFRSLIRLELGVEPSHELAAMLAIVEGDPLQLSAS